MESGEKWGKVAKSDEKWRKGLNLGKVEKGGGTW